MLKELESLMHVGMYRRTCFISRYLDALREYHTENKVKGCKYKHVYALVAECYPYVSVYAESKKGACWIVFDRVAQVVAHSRLEGSISSAKVALACVSEHPFFKASIEGYPGFGFPRVDSTLVEPDSFLHFPPVQPFPAVLPRVVPCSQVEFSYQRTEQPCRFGEPEDFGFDLFGQVIDISKVPDLWKTVDQRSLDDPQLKSILRNHIHLFGMGVDRADLDQVRQKLFDIVNSLTPLQLQSIKSMYG